MRNYTIQTFFVDNLHEVFKAADILSMYEVPFDVTPTRHGITKGEDQSISLTHLETVTKHLLPRIFCKLGICLLLHGTEDKIGRVFSITVENYLSTS